MFQTTGYNAQEQTREDISENHTLCPSPEYQSRCLLPCRDTPAPAESHALLMITRTIPEAIHRSVASPSNDQVLSNAVGALCADCDSLCTVGRHFRRAGPGRDEAILAIPLVCMRRAAREPVLEPFAADGGEKWGVRRGGQRGVDLGHRHGEEVVGPVEAAEPA